MAAAPPQPCDDGSAFQTKVHTPHAVLCGDFNAAGLRCRHRGHLSTSSVRRREHGFKDAWPLVHGSAPHAPTFRLFDTTYGADPMACDFVFVSAGLAPQVRNVQVDLHTRASDHQPVLVEFGNDAKG